MSNPATSGQRAADGYPGARYAWYMVILLTVAYVCSFIDRFMLGLLVEPIKADLGLSDTQLGLCWVLPCHLLRHHGPAPGLAGGPLQARLDCSRRHYGLVSRNRCIRPGQKFLPDVHRPA